MKPYLFIIDRDGTLIELVDYFGKEEDWIEHLKLNFPMLQLLKYMQKKYQSETYIISNQQGVARGYFSCKRVEEINSYIDSKLNSKGIKINEWNYCPDVDESYASSHPEISFDSRYIKERTKRKPSIEMVLDCLKKNKRRLEHFDRIFIFGDENVDSKLAKNLGGFFFDVNSKDYKQIKELLYIMERK